MCSGAALRALYKPRPAPPSTAQQIRVLLNGNDREKLWRALDLITNKRADLFEARGKLEVRGERMFKEPIRLKTPIKCIGNLLRLKQLEQRESIYAKHDDKVKKLLGIMGPASTERAGVPRSVGAEKEIDVFDLCVKAAYAPDGSPESKLWKEYLKVDDRFDDRHQAYMLDNGLGREDDLNEECLGLYNERENAFDDMKRHARAEGYTILPEKGARWRWMRPGVRA